MIRRPCVCSLSTATSPFVRDPSSYSAQTLACSTLIGQTCPLQPKRFRSESTAAKKSPLYCSIIDSSKLPLVCPPKRPLSSPGSRERRIRRASASFRARASAHLRTSPGGRTPSWSRSCPELPPLSNIVTTAWTCTHGLCLSPPIRLGSPVPPPKHPISSSRSRTAGIVQCGLFRPRRGARAFHRRSPTRIRSRDRFDTPAARAHP